MPRNPRPVPSPIHALYDRRYRQVGKQGRAGRAGGFSSTHAREAHRRRPQVPALEKPLFAYNTTHIRTMYIDGPSPAQPIYYVQEYGARPQILVAHLGSLSLLNGRADRRGATTLMQARSRPLLSPPSPSLACKVS